VALVLDEIFRFLWVVSVKFSLSTGTRGTGGKTQQGLSWRYRRDDSAGFKLEVQEGRLSAGFELEVQEGRLSRV
jgi:hypothetical protein